MNDKKRILKQFEWFQVQTKVRQIIAEVVQPIEKRLLSNTLSISKLQTRSQTQQKKVQYLTMMVNNDANIFEHGIFARIDDKIKQTTVHTKQLESKVHHLQQFIDKKVELLQLRLRESSHVLDGLREFKQYVDEEISNQNNKLVQSQLNLFSNFDQINHDISQSMVKIVQLKQEQEANSLKLAQFQKDQTEHVEHLGQTIDKFTSEIKQIGLKQEYQGEGIQKLQEEIKRVSRFQKYTRQLQAKIDSLSIAVDNVEYKAEVIQPIVALTQINEYAHHVLPSQYRNNVSIYYYNRYREMVEEIIGGELSRDDKREKVASSRKSNLQLVKQVHKRSIKCVFKVKKHKLAEQGIDIDSLTHDKKQQLLSNMRLNEQFSDIVATKNAPQKQDNRQKLQQDQYNQLRDRLANDLKARIEQQLHDSKRYIIEMEELLRKDLEVCQQQLGKLERVVTEAELNLQLEGKYLRQIEQQFGRQINNLQKDGGRIFECLRNINAVVSVHQLIEKQDERDRLSIALLGVRQHHRDELKDLQQMKRNPVELNPNCLSCSGNANYYNQFFKMACLNYTSSPIKLNNQSYERIELLDKTQAELIKLATSLDQPQPPQNPKQKPIVQQKMHRYESQIMMMPSRDSRSASDTYMIRNVSTSQEMRTARIDKSAESPRVINSNELVENLLNKSANRLFNRKRDGLRDYKRKKEGNSRESKERTEYMINLSGYFKELKKQNQSFIK